MTPISFAVPGGGAEPNQAEGAGHGHPCADAAVDQHNDDLDNGGQDRQGYGKALGALGLIHTDKGRADAQKQGYCGADQEGGNGDSAV